MRFEAANLRDAYLKLRQFMPEINAENRIALAKWCINNSLNDEARTELEDAIRREPQRREARELIRRLDRSSASSTALLLTLPNSNRTETLEFDGPEMKSLAGLSRKTAEQFVARVQPLLVNKCSNAGCHSSTSRQEFRMRRIRTTGGHRVFSQQNLAAVFKQIDMARPDDSRLLTALVDDHARHGRPLFDNRAGKFQINTIRDWVHAAVAEKSDKNPISGQSPNSTQPSQPQLREATTIIRPAAGNTPVATAPDEILGQRADAGTLSNQTLSAMLAGFGHSGGATGPVPDRLADHQHGIANRQPPTQEHPGSMPTSGRTWLPDVPITVPDFGATDPFDPDEFNRTYGGRQAASTTAPRVPPQSWRQDARRN